MSNSSKQKIVVFDIDGTLADTSNRIHHVKPKEGEKKNWSAFFKEAENDAPIHYVINLTYLYHQAGYSIVLCTGRPANLRHDTQTWLTKHGVIYSDLLMRLTTDRGPDYEVKGKTLLEFLKANKLELSQVEAVYEDRIPVAEMWRKMGLNVFLCGEEWRP